MVKLREEEDKAGREQCLAVIRKPSLNFKKRLQNSPSRVNSVL